LLKLRKVEVVGFKSFCEKTHLTFSGTGLTCIIGPNGCGKSNIVDAISWVLGEQSTKSLRAERMADCIFNGTARRPPMGLAQVTLTLVDSELAEAARFVMGEGGPRAAAEEPLTSADNRISADESISADNRVSEEPVVEITEIPEGSLPAEPSAEEASVAAGAATGAAEESEGPEGERGRKPFGRKRAAQKSVAEIRPGEVVIGRRLYRSGQSEYLINGRPARLRDIQELFMGIGLGPDSYAIIEQGRIGQVLSSKPSDRRAIIEEAAGITKYKTKKRLAEAKLESSKLNLSRVNDIYVEVEKQLASLKRQASKARRYAELREQMRALLRQVFASKAIELDGEAQRLADLLGQIATVETEQAQSVAQFEAEQQRLDLRIDEVSAELRQTANLIGQTSLELDRSENRVVFNKQRGEELTQRSGQIAGENQQIARQIAQIEERLAAQNDVVGRLREESNALESVLAALAGRSSELAGSTQTTEAFIAGLGRQIAEFDDRLKNLQTEQAQAGESLAHHSGALERLEQTEHQLLEESLHYRERSHVAEIRWQAVTEQARALEQAEQAAHARVADLRREQQTTAARNEGLRDGLSGTRARLRTLEQILQDHSYTAEAVQKLFASKAGSGAGGFRAVGVLADYAEVQPQYEGAVEQFLRDELEYVVVETFDHAHAGIALLRDEVGGRATFFVDSLRHLKLEENESAIPFAGEPGMVSRLDGLVEFRDPLGAAAKQFLPRLQSAFLVESPEAAERLARENPRYSFLTPDGTCVQGRTVSGGRHAEAGPLLMKRELRSLQTEAARLEQEVADAQAALQRLEAGHREAERVLQETAAQNVEAGKSVVGATLERDQSRGQLARLGMELSSCQKEIERLRQESKAAQQQAERAIAERQQALQSREAAERQRSEAAASLEGMRQAVKAQQEELAAKRVEKASLDERFSSAAAIFTRLAEENNELAARAGALSDQLAAIAAEQQDLLRQNEEQQQKTESLRGERQRLETQRAELESEWEQARVRTAEADHAARTARQKLNDLREERSHHEVERARNDSEREHLREACRNELNLQPEDLIAEQPALLGGEELAAADASYREMKERMAAMGAVNMMALEEYNECEQRFEFLGRERQDLLQSIADTQQAITELDQVSRQKFEEAFSRINAHFADAFQTLFGGGTGQMRLSEADTGGETGIDIAAQPPGKRLQNVLLLSGGEKALTALALLIAIFRYQPSPFCILDEVDAPLDETNVGRFAQMVAQMSVDAQFIVVTHNRRTMEMASVLYGVTMQEPGVSKLVSVSWEQARAVATSNAA